MACRTIHLPGGGLAIVCGPRVRRPLRRCIVCNVPETMATIKLCDGLLHTKKGVKTCDQVICIDHAYHVDPDTDLCPRHAGQAPQSSA